MPSPPSSVAYPGLQMIECMNLELEKINRGPEFYTITHSRAKQRSDKMYISSNKPAILVMANRLAGSGKKTLGQQEESNTLAQQVDNYDYANMEEDQEMCMNAGIPLTTSTCKHGMQ